MKRILFSFAITIATLQTSCGGSASKLQGHYVNARLSHVTLDISSNTFSGHEGPMAITATYSVISDKDNVVTVELTAEHMPKATATIQVADDSLTISSRTPFNGTWKRK